MKNAGNLAMSALLIGSLSTGANAEKNSSLEASLMGDSFKSVGTYRINQVSKDVSKVLEESNSELKEKINLDSLNLYGVSKRENDTTYAGAGLSYESDNSKVVIEKGSDFLKASGVYKYDVPNTNFHIKGGAGYLKKEINIGGTNKDITQKNIGLAVGYTDEKTYGVEAGHIVYKLDGAGNADGNSNKSFVEGIYKHDLSETSSIEATGVIKNTRVYGKNYSDYTAGLNYYPTNDIKAGAIYDSVDNDKNNYQAMAGIKYTFETGKISPYFSLVANTSKNVAAILEYSENIRNKPISMRDEFENSNNTSEIVAQSVTPEVFAEKSNPEVESISRDIEVIVPNTAPTISSISYVDNNGNSITQGDIISLSATIGDENVATTTWQVIERSTSNANGGNGTVLASGTGQFTGYDYTIGNVQGGQLTVELSVTDAQSLNTTATLIDQAIQ